MEFFNNHQIIIPLKYQHHIENIFDDFHKKFNNVILSCYFCSKKDPIHHKELTNQKQETDNYEYIKPLYESCLKNNIHLIIFYDILSNNFIQKYQNDFIIFKKTKLVSNLSINDERFVIYFEYLLKNPYKNVLSCDISDVYINKNPFDLFENYFKVNKKLKEKIINSGFLHKLDKKLLDETELDVFLKYNSTYFTEKELSMIFSNITENHEKNDYKIFIGTNSVNNNNDLQWFERRIDKINNFNKVIFPNFIPEIFQIYNPGTLMSNYHSYMCFIKKFLEILFKLGEKYEKNNWNMIITNYIIRNYLFDDINYKNACTKYIYTGFPFNSIYKRKEIIGLSPSYLIHK